MDVEWYQFRMNARSCLKSIKCNTFYVTLTPFVDVSYTQHLMRTCREFTVTWFKHIEGSIKSSDVSYNTLFLGDIWLR